MALGRATGTYKQLAQVSGAGEQHFITTCDSYMHGWHRFVNIIWSSVPQDEKTNRFLVLALRGYCQCFLGSLRIVRCPVLTLRLGPSIKLPTSSDALSSKPLESNSNTQSLHGNSTNRTVNDMRSKAYLISPRAPRLTTSARSGSSQQAQSEKPGFLSERQLWLKCRCISIRSAQTE